MCRNIRRLFNYEPPATEEEVRDAALQFVRKISGSTRPSKRNEAAFDLAVTRVAAAVHELMAAMESDQPARNREADAEKARQKSAARFS